MDDEKYILYPDGVFVKNDRPISNRTVYGLCIPHKTYIDNHGTWIEYEVNGTFYSIWKYYNVNNEYLKRYIFSKDDSYIVAGCASDKQIKTMPKDGIIAYRLQFKDSSTGNFYEDMIARLSVMSKSEEIVTVSLDKFRFSTVELKIYNGKLKVGGHGPSFTIEDIKKLL